jgi:hypothetical protein
MPELKYILPYVIWTLAGMTLLLIICIFIIRTRFEMSKFFWGKVKRIIEGIVLARLFDHQTAFDSNSRHAWSLRIVRKVPGIRKKMLEYILELKKNIAGKERVKLNNLLYDFDLTSVVTTKLKSGNWSEITKGLNEIKEFQNGNLYDEVMPFLYSKNRRVKMAAYRALIRLLPGSNLYFLCNTDLFLSEMDQIQLHYELTKRKFEIPEFESLLHSKNTSVVLFAIKMISAFQQHSAVEKLTGLLDHEEEKIAIESLKALKELNAVGITDLLMFKLFIIDSAPLLIAYLETLIALAHGRNFPLLEAYRWYPDDQIRAIFNSNIRHLTEQHNLLSKAS